MGRLANFLRSETMGPHYWQMMGHAVLCKVDSFRLASLHNCITLSISAISTAGIFGIGTTNCNIGIRWWIVPRYIATSRTGTFVD